MGCVMTMPAAGGNQTVEIRKPVGGNRSVFSGPFRAAVDVADPSGRGAPSHLVTLYRYSIELPPGFRLMDDDGTTYAVSQGDILLTDLFPGQDLPLSEPSVEGVGPYGEPQVIFYFSALGGEQRSGR